MKCSAGKKEGNVLQEKGEKCPRNSQEKGGKCAGKRGSALPEGFVP